MKKYYLIEPEVAGSIADSDFLDVSARPPKINKLVYRFDGWLGDDIVECIMTYIITERLRAAFEKEKFSGAQFDEVDVIKSEQFKYFYHDKELPQFFWLKITGLAGEDDFGYSNKRLAISETALNVIKKFNAKHIEVENYV